MYATGEKSKRAACENSGFEISQEERARAARAGARVPVCVARLARYACVTLRGRGTGRGVVRLLWHQFWAIRGATDVGVQ